MPRRVQSPVRRPRTPPPPLTSGKPRAAAIADHADGARRRILDATLSLLAEGSYAGTSISSICRRSGLPPTSIYWHFESKEGLLAAVLEEGAERWFQSTFEWEEPGGDLLEGLGTRMEQLLDLLVEDPPFLRLLVMLALERKHTDDACIKTVRRVRTRATDRLVRWFAAAFPHDGAAAETPARELATFALSMFDGVMLAHQIDPAGADLPRLLDQMREALLALAQARGAEIGSRSPTRTKRAPRRTSGEHVNEAAAGHTSGKTRVRRRLTP